jgi:predicted amidohydrolase
MPINQSHVIGSLTVGQQADITVLKIIDTDIDLEDCQSQTRRVKKLIRPVAVWKGGRPFDITKPAFFPNTDARARNASAWNKIIIRDSTPPVELKTK